MNGKERVIRTLTFDRPDRLPVQSWCLRSAFLKYGKPLEAAVEKFANDFFTPDCGIVHSGEQFIEKGTFTDAWGCVWRNLCEGITGEVKYSPLSDNAALRAYKPPIEALGHGWDKVDDSIRRNEDMFVLTPWTINIFERMQFLRGTETLLIDLAEDSDEVRLLRDIVYDFYAEWLKRWLERDVDGVIFSDDWGTQKSLLISPRVFRSFFKPLYRELMDRCRKAGKFVFFHSDGYIAEIIDDLVELGVNALNCQTALMGVDMLSERYRGKLTFWGETDRQKVLPFGSVKDVRDSITALKAGLMHNGGGLIGVCGAGAECSLDNIVESLRGWNEEE